MATASFDICAKVGLGISTGYSQRNQYSAMANAVAADKRAMYSISFLQAVS
ncbi:hypothetical protein OsI_03017 [Oryza sativa Indica Group]|uniref:Uncharacterized protein n=2 Tax=Oryza sativa TaxID=4530 RepID=A2ZVV7_ORYSJ|nr:hypothetical protein OsI_03014 [Oryza sativa Indica Group]EAY75123.1 hypothetical protein OsI_03017 [Oryza sativa Indica Group]EAZ12854.1 hypothetical protein OsJ_02774 [Oryza sativa Japonica Group]